MRKIIVTGYNGFIGSLLVPLLVQKGYKVVGIDVDYYDRSCELFAPAGILPKKVKKDIRQVEETDIEGAYAICHLAALSNDPIGEMDRELTYDINYRATVRLAKLAKEAGVEKFIFSSSCSIYGVAGDEALSEEAEFAPITAYAESKVWAERDLMPLNDQNFCVTLLRNSTAYGISPKHRVDLVVNNLVGWAVTTGQIKIMSDGTPWRPLLHGEDIARAFLAVIEAVKENVAAKAFNVGLNSENYRIKDIAYLVKEVMPQCEVVITGEYGSDSRTYRVNFDKISRELPEFKPRWDLRKGIEQIYQAYLRYKMDSERFGSRSFIRLKQIKYLRDCNKLDSKLYWA